VNQRETIGKTDAWVKGMEGCAEKLKANREKSDALAEHQEVPNEETAVETIGALGDVYGDRHLAKSRRQLKKRTQANGGSRQMLAAARRRMTRRVITASRKGQVCQRPDRDCAARGAPKGRTFERRRWLRLECNTKTKDRGARRPLRLKKERTLGRIFRKTVDLEIEKRIVVSPTGLRKVSDWTEAPKGQPSEKMVVYQDRLGPYQGTAWDERP
jgi:hypothetical protein